MIIVAPNNTQKGFITFEPQMNLLTTDTFAADGIKDDLEKVDGQKVKAYLKEYASVPHMAGWNKAL
jgi:hypothetical protein